jgi:hypothetical protein
MGGTVDIDRLSKLCGLFGSDHLGERAAAALQADRIVRAAGLSRPDVFAANNAAPLTSKTSRRRETPENSWRQEVTPAMLLATYGAALTGWERCFLTGLIKRPNWSKRQREVLCKIQGRFA